MLWRTEVSLYGGTRTDMMEFQKPVGMPIASQVQTPLAIS